MTRSITLTLPDYVVKYLEDHPDADRVVADAVNKQLAETLTTPEILDALGFRSTEETRAWARHALQPLTDEQRAENQRRRDLLSRQEWPEEQR